MKKIILMLLLTTIGGIAIAQQKNRYNIQGEITGSKANEVYLEYFTNGGFVRIDTTKLVGGKFKFKGEADPMVGSIYIRVADGKGYTTVFVEKGTIKVKTSTELMLNAEVKGGKNSELLNNYYLNDNRLYNEQMASLDKHHKMNEKGLKDSADYFSARFKEYEQKVKDNLEKFVADSKGTPAGFYYFRNRVMGRATPESIFAFTKEYGNEPINYDYKEILTFSDALIKTAIGANLIEIAYPNKDGKIITVSSLKGKYVLLDFWASWCGPCRKEAKHLKELYSIYANEGFEIVGVSIDRNKNAWLKAMEEDQTPWIHILDEQNNSVKEFGISGIPRLMLISPDGKIINNDIRGKELDAKLKEIFKK